MTHPKQNDASKSSSLEAFLVRRGTLILVALVLLFVVAYSAACWVKFLNYLYWDVDLAHHVQECHNILHGSLDNTLLGTNFLGNHFALIMFPVALVYALVPSPLTLLILQVLAAASAAFPLYFLFRRLLSHAAALALAVVYLAHPALGYTLLYEFHPVVFALAFLMWAFWAFPFAPTCRGRFWTFLLFALLALASQENVSFILVMLGFFALAFVRQARLRWTATPLLLGLVWFVVVMGVVMPHLNQGKVDFYSIYRAEWGESVPQIARSVVSHPVKAVQFLYSTPGVSAEANTDSAYKKSFYLYLFLPVLFLSVLSPSTLVLLLPVLLQQMLSGRYQEHTILWHYPALLLPVVMLSAGMGLRNLLRWLTPRAAIDAPFLSTRVRITSLVFSLALVLSVTLCHFTFGPFGPSWASVLPGSQLFKSSSTPVQELCHKHWDRMVALVPPDVPVVATFAFQARLADRARIYSYHHLYSGAYTLAQEPFPLPEGIQAALIDFADPLLVGSWASWQAGPRMRRFLAREQLQPVMIVGSTVLFLRHPPDDLPAIPLYQVLDQLGNNHPVIEQDFAGVLRLVSAELPKRNLSPGDLLPLQLYWRSSSSRKLWLDFQIHLVNQTDHVIRSLPVLVPLGYNLYPPFEWDRIPVTMQNAAIPLPDDFPEGPADVYLSVLVIQDSVASPLATESAPDEARVITARLGRITVAGSHVSH